MKKNAKFARNMTANTSQKRNLSEKIYNNSDSQWYSAFKS